MQPWAAATAAMQALVTETGVAAMDRSAMGAHQPIGDKATHCMM
jgi:hypothetical protein